MRHRRGYAGALVAALLLAAFAAKDVLIAPPPVPAVAPGEFDTGRALGRLARILGDQRPHPVDSDANDAVRSRLIAELRAIGLRPEVHEASDCSAMPKSRVVSCVRVRNVVATLGTGPSKHLLLNSHYDSTPTGPGAADDGLGVATMIEVAALLKANPAARPVTFLFNEGEEFGLNGAAAFVRGDPLAALVDSLINIEARGVDGPALMFETSDPNAAAVAAYAGAARCPYANSLSTDFARLIPNTTDAVYFKPRGWTLLNYSIIGNETRYHSPGDTVEALDRASLHHVGSEVLAATRGLGAASPAANGGRTVFIDVAGRLFLRLPLILAGLILAGLVVGAFVLARRRQALGRPLLLAAAMTAGGIAAAAAGALLLVSLRAGDFWRATPLVSYLAVYALLLAAMTAIWCRWGKDADRARMRAAAWLVVLVVGGAASLALPGASIFFLIAPALGLAAVALGNRWLALAAIVVQLLMFAQLLALVELLLVDGPLWAGAPLAALAALPLLIEARAADFRLTPAALLVAGLGLGIAALAIPRISEARPGPFTIEYFRDDSARKAHWAVATQQAPLPAAFPGQWTRGVLPYNGRTRWIAPAPMLEVPAPALRVLASAAEGDGRRVRLELSQSGANAVAIRFDKSANVRALGLAGAPVTIPTKGEPEKAVLRCSGRACDGLVIDVLFGDRATAKGELIATRFALPGQGRALPAARPPGTAPQYGPDSSIRLRPFAL